MSGAPESQDSVSSRTDGPAPSDRYECSTTLPLRTPTHPDPADEWSTLRHSTFRIYRFRFLNNAAIELVNPRKEHDGEFAPTAITPLVATKAIVPGSGTVDPVPLAQLLIELSSKVTAPLSAMTLPQLSEAPVFSVSLAKAMRVPSNAVVLPRVAELPTFFSIDVSVGFENEETTVGER